MSSNQVLIVDDEFVIRELFKSWLELEGYEVCTASNGHEGIKRFQETDPQLVVSDILMPGMDGYEFCGLVRQISDVPIMMITGIADVEAERERMRRLNLNINVFMSKPIMMDTFLNKVTKLIGSPNPSGDDAAA